MSAFPDSGGSDHRSLNEIRVRLRPIADIRGDHRGTLVVSCQSHAEAFRRAGSHRVSFVDLSLPQSTNEVLGEVRAGNQNRPENDEEEAKATNGGSRVYAFGRGQVVNQ